MMVDGGQRGRTCLIVIVISGVVLCLLGAALLCLAQLWLPRSSLPIGYELEVCVKVVTAGRFQIQVMWFWPFISSFAPPASATCAFIPWAPFLPQRGGFVFPP